MQNHEEGRLGLERAEQEWAAVGYGWLAFDNFVLVCVKISFAYDNMWDRPLHWRRRGAENLRRAGRPGRCITCTLSC